MRGTFTLAALLLLVAAPLAKADDTAVASEVKGVAQTLGDQTVSAAKIEDRGERRRLLRAAADPAMDFKAIAAGVLAYAGAKVPPNRESEVMDEVIGYVAENITGEIERIRPDKATIGAVQVKGEREARVAMTLAGAQNAIDAQWLFKKSAAGWRVSDVEVSGNLLTQHFGEKLSRYSRGVDQLVEYLRQQQKRSNSQTALRQ